MNMIQLGNYKVYKNNLLVAECHNTMTNFYRQNLFRIIARGTTSDNLDIIKINHFKVGRSRTPATEMQTELLDAYPDKYMAENSVIYNDYLFTYFIIGQSESTLSINEIGMFNYYNKMLSRVVLPQTITKSPLDEIIIERKDVLLFKQ